MNWGKESAQNCFQLNRAIGIDGQHGLQRLLHQQENGLFQLGGVVCRIMAVEGFVCLGMAAILVPHLTGERCFYACINR